MSSDAGALRDSVVNSTSTDWRRDIELGVGPITFSLARAALAFVDLDPDAGAGRRARPAAARGV
jgi:hypothetical protein